jgi:hypothetical protein
MLRPAKKELEKMDKDRAQKIYDHIGQLKIEHLDHDLGWTLTKWQVSKSLRSTA